MSWFSDEAKNLEDRLKSGGGLLGGGGGTLGLGGTDFDPSTWALFPKVPDEEFFQTDATPPPEAPITYNPNDAGRWLRARKGVNLGVPIIYGTRRTGGHIIYQAVSENTNWLYVVYALAEGIQQAWTLYIDNGDGLMVPYDESKYYSASVVAKNTVTGDETTHTGQRHLWRIDTNQSTGTSEGLVIEFNPDAITSGLGNSWSNQHNCKGVACEGLSFVYDNVAEITGPGSSFPIKEFQIESFYRGGLPKIEFEMTGMPLVDETGIVLENCSITEGNGITSVSSTENLSKYMSVTSPYHDSRAQVVHIFDSTSFLSNYWATATASNVTIAFNAESSSDPAWVLYDYLTNGTYGCNLDASLINAASFTTASAICNVTSDSTKRYECNIILDSRASLLANIKRILSCCNGHLNWINGEYYLQIDDAFTGTAVFAFLEKHIIGGLAIVGNSKNERTNQVTCKFVNPNRSWQEDEVSWPDKNNETSLFDSYLAADNSIPLRKTITVSGVTNYNQARFLAKQACLRSRDALKVSFKTTSEAMNVVVGDIITVTHSTPAWSAKEFRVRSLSLNMDGTCSIAAAEHVDATYAWDYLAPPAAADDTNLPDVTSVSAPSSLSISETTYASIRSGGRKIRVTVEWLQADDVFVEKNEVEFKKSADTTWTEGGETSGNSVVLNDFEKGDHNFRVRSVNSVGTKSTWYTIENEAILGVTDIPEDVTGFTVQNHGDNATVTWDEPDDATDIDHIAIGVLQEGSTEWDDAVIVANVGTGNTSTIVPVIKGNYVAKFVNSGGFESVDYMESGTVTVYGSELVATYAEQEAWAGTMDGLYETVDTGDDVLKFLGTVNWDDFTMEMDYWGQVDEQGGRSETAHYTGVARDLGAVLPLRVYSNKVFTSAVSDGSNFLDNWGSIDARDSWDETTSLDSLITQIRITQDDPDDAGATWTAYKPFIVADVVARGLQMKVSFDQFSENEQFTLRELELLVDMVVRFESDRAKTATSITYDDPFYAIPDLVVTPVNMVSGDWMAITEETKTGFDIDFKNSSGGVITRNYNYHARGF